MVMTASQLISLLDQQNGIAKKVFECVPVNEAFDAQRICTELKRMGSAPDLHIVRGCLNTLKESGLIVEGMRGLFQRVKVRADPATIKRTTQPTKIAEEKPVNAAAPEVKDPIEIFAAAASQLRAMAKTLEGVATQIEDAALRMADQSADNNQEVKAARQLLDLLKTLK